MKSFYSVNEFAAIMKENEIEEPEKICEILKKCGVRNLEMKPTETTLKAEMPVATPQQLKHNGIVSIEHSEYEVIARYEKNEDFIEIVKNLNFRWNWNNRNWYLRINNYTGTVENVIAELGNHLLNVGFTVRFETRDLLDLAVTANYEPMCKRWIKYSEGYFYISWGREDDLYDVCMTLPNAKFDKTQYSIKVPEKNFDAVIDFAEQYWYKFSEKTQARINELQSNVYRVTPNPIKENKRQKKEQNFDILEDLKDE